MPGEIGRWLAVFAKIARVVEPGYVQGLLRDAAPAILAGLLALVSGLVLCKLSAKRMRQRKAYRSVLTWAKKGRKDSLRGAYLKGLNFTEVDLAGADLRNSDFRGAELVGANLQGTDLRRANLQGADLRRANIQGAALEGANLQEASLWRANLQEAEMRRANLQGADLRGANIQGAALWGANLQRAYLWDANLRGARLGGTRLKGAWANTNTIWPNGFEIPEGVMIENERLAGQ